MSKWLILLVGIVGFSVTASAQRVTHYLADHPEYPKYLEGVIVADIVYPGQDFRRLESFGEPMSRKSGTSSGHKTWTLMYDGFQLEFMDLYGEPELRRLWIKDPGVAFTFQGEKLIVERPMATVMDNASFKQIDKNESMQSKYRGSFLFLEVVVDQSGAIKEIQYHRDPRL